MALASIGEIATREIVKKENPYGLEENKKVAKRGGGVAKVALDCYEKEVEKTAVTSKNILR